MTLSVSGGIRRSRAHIEHPVRALVCVGEDCSCAELFREFYASAPDLARPQILLFQYLLPGAYPGHTVQQLTALMEGARAQEVVGGSTSECSF